MKIQGKDYNVRFSYKALKNFTQKTGLKLQDLGNISFEHIDILLWCGLKSGAEFNKEKFSTTLEEVTEWLDEDLSLMTKVMDAFSEDMAKMGEAQPPGEGAT